MSVSSELRCPVGPQKLLAKVLSDGDQPSFVKPDNLIELACLDCKRDRLSSGVRCKRVLHRFNILGELVETLVVELSGSGCMSHLKCAEHGKRVVIIDAEDVVVHREDHSARRKCASFWLLIGDKRYTVQDILGRVHQSE